MVTASSENAEKMSFASFSMLDPLEEAKNIFAESAVSRKERPSRSASARMKASSCLAFAAPS